MSFLSTFGVRSAEFLLADGPDRRLGLSQSMSGGLARRGCSEVTKGLLGVVYGKGLVILPRMMIMF